MTSLEQVKDLESKIAAAKIRLSELYYSIDALKASITDPSGCHPTVPWSENAPIPAYVEPNYALCTNNWRAITAETIAARKLESDVKGWQAAIETLKSDPDVKAYYNNKTVVRYVIIGVIVIVIITVGIWIYKKYVK